MKRRGGGDGMPVLLGRSHHGAAGELGGCKAFAVLRHALQVQNLIECYPLLGLFHLITGTGAVQQAHLDGTFDHRLAGNQLHILHLAHSGHIQNGLRRLGKLQLLLRGNHLIQAGQTLDALHRFHPLLDAAIRQSGDHLLIGAAGHPGAEGIGPPQVHPALVHRPAVQIFQLTAHLDAVAGIIPLRQIHSPGEGQLLFGLAQALVLLGLVIHHTPQVAVHSKAAGRDLFLQRHQVDEAFYDLEHLRQIIRNKDLRLHRKLCLGFAQAPHGGQRVPEHLQFHFFAPFARF